MIRKGSLVRFVGKSKVIAEDKLLAVHDVKDDKAVVWILGSKGWSKKTVMLSDLEVIVE